MSETWLVVGLGNPGPSYQYTRHNAGAMVLDELAHRLGATFSANKAGALVASARLFPGGPQVILAKPTTFMNLSGAPTQALANFYKIPADHVIAVHDDVDLPFDTIKLKLGGGEGGHNGLRDISQRLGTKDYLRVRLGVGRPPGRQDTADYVLKRFSSAEAKNLPIFISDGADAVEYLIAHGLLDAQQKYHAR